MSKSKEMFTQMREQENHDSFIDDSYQFNEWMSELHTKENHNSNSAIDELNDLFVTFGKIFCNNNNKL
jgi:hypothetical protein